MAVENPKEKTIKIGSEIDTLPIEVKKNKHKAELPQSKKTYDIDLAIKEILDIEKLPPGKIVYDPKKLHPMNPEYTDEYIDEDDPGFDTYVVNEENFVASC